MEKRYSIIQKEKRCYICGTMNNIHIHEIFFGRNRKKSIEDGCCIYLCGFHHNLSSEGIHFNHKLDVMIKKEAEKRWCEYYNKTIDDFRERYGRNYL